MAAKPKSTNKKRINPTKRDTGFKLLRAMKCFQTVHEYLCEGMLAREVARYIQEDCREYKQAKRSTLETVLNNYRNTIPPAQLIKRRMPKLFHKVATEVNNKLDELEEYEKLYKMQMERINVDFQTEKKINKLMPTMTQEIRVAREILSSYADLKMDLGLSKRHLGQVDVDTRIIADISAKYETEVVGHVVSKPESRRKLMQLADKLLGIEAGDDLFAVDEEEIIDVTPSEETDDN
jgi:hypothetical protein